MAKKGKTCVKPVDCRIVVARQNFNAAKSCSARDEAADVFRAVVAKRFRTLPKAEKAKLFKEALSKKASAARACGRESEARRIEEAKIAADRERIVGSYAMDGYRRSSRKRRRR